MGKLSKIVREARIWLKELYIWLRTIWPFYLFVVGIAAHHIFLWLLPGYISTINKTFTASFQFGGGILVLYSIRSNMFKLSKKTYKDLVKQWVKSFPVPFRNRSIVIDAGHFVSKSSLSADIKLVPKLFTFEEKIDFLFKEIERLDSKAAQIRNDLNKEIRAVSKDIEKQQNELNNRVQEINRSLEVYGMSVKAEFFGVLCILYGVLIPVLF